MTATGDKPASRDSERSENLPVPGRVFSPVQVIYNGMSDKQNFDYYMNRCRGKKIE